MTWAAVAYSMDVVASVEMAERNGRRAVMVDPVMLRETVEQRDQLLAALEEMVEEFGSIKDKAAQKPIAHARAAIARARGGQ